MRRIVLWVMSTITVVVMMFGYKTSTSGAATASDQQVISRPATSTNSTSTSGSGSSGAKTYTGDVAQTRWGPVQVQIKVSGGKVTAVSVPQYPNDNPRDQEINSYALPVLIQETTDAQSAEISMVSGATVTSVGYVQSLQSALDQAGL